MTYDSELVATVATSVRRIVKDVLTEVETDSVDGWWLVHEAERTVEFERLAVIVLDAVENAGYLRPPGI